MINSPQISLVNANDIVPIMIEKLLAALDKRDEQRKRLMGEKIYTINGVAKKLGRNHATIKKYCRSGIIRTCAGGGIPESAIIEYLEGGRK